MSENLDLVRSIFSDWERRGDLNSFWWAHPDLQLVLADGPEPGTWSGLADVEGFVRDWMSAWEDNRIEADEYRELDDEHVFVLARGIGRGRASGLEVETKVAWLFHIRDGKVARYVGYFDRDRGLADLGLEE